MATAVRWVLVAAVVALVGVVPIVYYRSVYASAKRLREVDPGRLYRSGQNTAEGFIDAFRRYGIHTVVNVQDEYPDPDLDWSFWGGGTIKESALCDSCGVRYVFIAPDLVSRRLAGVCRPGAIEDFLAVMDNPDSYPVLLHCHAGLHRTGVLTAVYRMEYQGWTPARAWQEMRAHGFGPWAGSAANDYVTQYVLTYRRGVRRPSGHGPDGSTASGPAGVPSRPTPTPGQDP
jgi:tyrosine-protein phosphatase SIW14